MTLKELIRRLERLAEDYGDDARVTIRAGGGEREVKIESERVDPETETAAGVRFILVPAEE